MPGELRVPRQAGTRNRKRKPRSPWERGHGLSTGSSAGGALRLVHAQARPAGRAGPAPRLFGGEGLQADLAQAAKVLQRAERVAGPVALVEVRQPRAGEVRALVAERPATGLPGGAVLERTCPAGFRLVLFRAAAAWTGVVQALISAAQAAVDAAGGDQVQAGGSGQRSAHAVALSLPDCLPGGGNRPAGLAGGGECPGQQVRGNEGPDEFV